MRRVQSLQNAAARLTTGARRRDHITPVLCQLHWLPVRRRVEFKLACLVRQALCGQMPIYLADDIHLVDPFGLPLITCARYHVRTTALETEALALSAHELGTVCRAANGHLTSATNILKHCWRHICFDKAVALCDILYKRLRNIFTYLLTYTWIKAIK